MLHRLRWLCLLLPALWIFYLPASAQTPSGEPTSTPASTPGAPLSLPGDSPKNIQVRLLPPQTEAFPHFSVFLDVHDSEENFIHGLQASDLNIFEDDTALPVSELNELHPGVQFVVTINPGPSFSIRDSKGVSRYDSLAGALRKWASGRQGSTLDDLSLLPVGGAELTHTSKPLDWITTLQNYQPETRAAVPSLDSLLRAVNVASDPAPRPGMERAVLFITAPISSDLSVGVQNILAQTKQQRIHLFIWLVGSPEYFDSPSARQLAELANQTAGKFFTFSGVEPVVDLESYLKPLRDIYQISYDSRIAGGGIHKLAAEVQYGQERVKSPAQDFLFDLRPPDPAFLSPNLEILRKYPLGIRNNLLEKGNPDNLNPKDLRLPILIDFPDGHLRPIVKSTLFVDGKPVDENTAPPFDEFTWNLRGYTTSGDHVLRVVVVDNMGLTGTSIDTIFLVKVEKAAVNPLVFLIRYWPLVVILVALLSGAVVFLALILGGRLHPQARNASTRSRRDRVPSNRRRAADLRTRLDQNQSEPRPAEVDGTLLGGWVNRLHWPQRRLAPQALAYLTRLTELNPSANTAVPVPVTADELTFGIDPRQATLILDEPSVEALHARLLRREDNSFLLFDEGSVAGTWVNYSPVLPEGTLLQHGDIIHIGRASFRFTQREPQPQRKPVVTLEEPASDSN